MYKRSVPSILAGVFVLGAWPAVGNQVSKSQERWIPQYEKQANIPVPGEMLINTDAEPERGDGFVDLYDGNSLEGWVPRGGHCTFEARGDTIVGTCVEGSPSTYLMTERDDYADFILTAEMKWEVDGNTGIMFRAGHRKGKKVAEEVYGPQVEMEGFEKQRYWSGGIYGQACGGWYYPLWLNAHEEARGALKEDAWNRITVEARGETVKTWLNGVPAAHWKNKEYLKGSIGLQVHSGEQGTILWRNIRVKELGEQPLEDLFAAGDFSQWRTSKGGEAGPGWEIADGVVHRKGGSGDILTKATYEDFELVFDWKVAEGGNSGVKYRVQNGKGMEYQLLDDERHKNGSNTLHRAAALYDILPASDEKSYKPAGEWNAGRIVARGSHIEHWLNGVKVLEIDQSTPEWEQRFSESKFRGVEGFGTGAGALLLQDHGDEVWFREVKVRRLSPAG